MIGSGSLLTNCLKFAVPFIPPGSVQCIETEPAKFSNLQNVCSANDVEYCFLQSRKELNTFFEDISKGSLVLSIHNNYIFGKAAIENPKLKIVNFHNALLPKHPGRNAPSWAIYEGDAEAGISWHEVVPAIDKGNIIFQSSVPVTPVMTGISLTRSLVAKGLESFKILLPMLLNNSYRAVEQAGGEYKMHYAHEIPNNGFADTGWSATRLSVFMRALDYGAYPVFPKPSIMINDICREIESYRIAGPGETETKGEPSPDEFCAADERVSIWLNLKTD